MNDEPTDDPELGHHLAAARDELVARPPRPDHRIEHLLGAAPPVFDDPTDELPVITLAPPVAAPTAAARRGGRLMVAAAVVATAVLVSAVATLAMRGDSGASLAAVSSGSAGTANAALAQETDGDGPSADDPETPPPATAQAPGAAESDDSKTFDEHNEWIECVLESVKDSVETGDGFDFDELRTECGEPPAVDLGNFGRYQFDPEHFDPEKWGFDELPFDPEKWGFDELPFDPEDFDPDKWGFDGLCDDESTADGVSLHCTWPPCEGEDCTPTECPDDKTELFCFGFGFELDGEMSDELDRWKQDLEEFFGSPSAIETDTEA